MIKGSGVVTADGEKYWVRKSGKLYTSKWRKRNGRKTYFFGSDGKMKRGEFAYTGRYKYCFDKKGRVQRDLFNYKGYKWLYKQKIRIDVNKKRNVINFMAYDEEKGKYSIPVYTCLCSVGVPGHHTPTGNYTTSPKRTHRWMKLGGAHIGTPIVWGQYVVHYQGRRYFHSCCYNSKSIYNMVTYNYNYLGRAASHGCIRMRAKDARRLWKLAKKKRLKVRTYSSSHAGPFGKPRYGKIPATQTYDPSDPSL